MFNYLTTCLCLSKLFTGIWVTSGLPCSQWMVDVSHVAAQNCQPGPRLNIKTVFPRYGDSHVKDKTVGETVLSLTWEALYW